VLLRLTFPPSKPIMVQGQSQQIFVSPAGSPPGNMTGGNMKGQ
jgi:hypothetical protein